MALRALGSESHGRLACARIGQTVAQPRMTPQSGNRLSQAKRKIHVRVSFEPASVWAINSRGSPLVSLENCNSGSPGAGTNSELGYGPNCEARARSHTARQDRG